jgi:hypothetical protein
MGQAVSRVEVWTEVVNTVIEEFILIFIAVNEIDDQARRAREFGWLSDEMVIRYQNRQPGARMLERGRSLPLPPDLLEQGALGTPNWQSGTARRRSAHALPGNDLQHHPRRTCTACARASQSDLRIMFDHPTLRQKVLMGRLGRPKDPIGSIRDSAASPGLASADRESPRQDAVSHLHCN